MSSDPLPYLEAYPRLDGIELRRVYLAKDGRTFCRFFSRSGQPRGWMQILDPMEGEEHMHVTRWKFTAPGIDPLVGRYPIKFIPEVGKVGRPAPLVCIRGCKKRTATLVFKGYWACAKCHGLRHRSTFLPRSVRDEERARERLAELTEKMAGGRPPYCRQDTYRGWREELKRLRRAAPTLMGLEANRDRLKVIESEWITEQDARTIHGLDPDDYFRHD